MAYVSNFGNLVQKTSPLNGEIEIAPDKQLTVSFIVDMNPSTVSNQTIVLLDDASLIVPSTVSYSNKVATLIPTSNLISSSRYQLIIKGGVSGVKSVVGQTLATDFNLNFTTSASDVPEKVILVSPVDKSALSTAPTFIWQSVVDATNYQFQISKESKFGSINFDNTIPATGTSYTPAFTYEPDTIYFWRVRALNGAAQGDWSDIWQSVYQPAPSEEDEQSQIGLGSTLFTFSIDKVNPLPDALFSTATGITVKFNAEIKSGLTINDYIKVQSQLLSGIGEPSFVNGLAGYTGDTITFTPTAAFLANTLYSVTISKEICDINNNCLTDDICWQFLTEMTPYYSSVGNVKAELGSLGVNIPDLTVAKMIAEVSLWADQISYQEYGSLNEEFSGERQQETTNSVFFHEYTKYETALRLLPQVAFDYVLEAGDSKQVGDLVIKKSDKLVENLNLLTKRLEALRDKFLYLLTLGNGTSSLPKSAVKGARKYPYPLNKRRSF